MGQLHRDLEQYEEELACATRSMAIREKALGPGHLEVGSSHWSMATALDNLGDYEKAQAHYEAAHGIFE
ncbi:MAG: tetratricopeptide repeat protein, partial [Myxococcaceae bacterium]